MFKACPQRSEGSLFALARSFEAQARQHLEPETSNVERWTMLCDLLLDLQYVMLSPRE
jgi:hypothetical protein